MKKRESHADQQPKRQKKKKGKEGGGHSVTFSLWPLLTHLQIAPIDNQHLKGLQGTFKIILSSASQLNTFLFPLLPCFYITYKKEWKRKRSGKKI